MKLSLRGALATRQSSLIKSIWIASLALAMTFFYSQANAQDGFGLAMVGAPKYNAADTHLKYANPNAPKGGTLKQSAIGSYDTLNPFNIKGKAAEGLALTTDRLMARVWDEPFTMYPLIAEKAIAPEDRSSIIFHLNPKAQFHDGSPITTADVLFSYKTLMEKGRPNMRRIYQLAKPSVIDKRSIKFDFGEGYDRETMMIFALMPILSEAYWRDKEFYKTTLDIPLSNGPYKIIEADAGKRIIYQRVEDYWAKDLLTNIGHHNFDQIIYDYYRDDTVALESFKKGDLNFRREWDAGKWNSAYNFTAIKNGDVTQEDVKHGRPDKVRGFIFNTRRAPFDDVRVRQALQKIFDFNWMNKNLFYSQYSQINSFYPNTDLARIPETKQPQSRREKLRDADALLKSAGWIIKDGLRVNADNNAPMSFKILLDNPADEKIALGLTRALKKIGIKADVRVLDSAAFRGRLNDYDFDMTLHYWHSTLSPGTEQYLYWSCESANTPSQWNYAGICDPEIDALAQSIPAAQSREELVTRTRALDQKLWDGAYFIPQYYNPNDFVAYWSPLTRPETTPIYGIVTETWWMAPQSDQP